jgi:hypothetical protein
LPSGATVRRKGPADIVTWLRTIGGVRDEGGELRALDAALHNRGRAAPYARGEQFLGRLVRPDGLTLEEAARRAAEAGYIGRRSLEAIEGRGGGQERVASGSPQELIDAIDRTLRAATMEERVWAEADDAAVRAYGETMRGIDEEEAFAPAPREERWLALDEEAEDYLSGLDPEERAALDDPEHLWQLEREMIAAEEARAGAGPEGARAPSPEAEIEAEARRYEAGFHAAAACVARGL